MKVVTTFAEKKREKQITNERRLLRELSLGHLKKSVLLHFSTVRKCVNPWLEDHLEEACFDVAIEAYLTGGEISRFTIYGETIDMAQNRCQDEILHYVDTLYHFWLYWDFGKETLKDDHLHSACERFVHFWWAEGFEKGKRRYKLRLH